ncbi:hypothetical protein [Brevibacillus reuszeri]|uniref:hypothetical protein n=1 Tax=Brevibacillus reuszeri TaxID=54915 RepID=UPI000CCC911B|nr:hypothetical protein [Brevibacillus reuszeri]
MKKFIIATMTVITALVPITAFAAPADVSSTSNFTLTVVEETLGLTISGVTNLPEVISKSDGGKQKIVFNDIGIQNSGNTKGVLYATVLDPTGISWGTANGELEGVSLIVPAGGITDIYLKGMEMKADTLMRDADTDNDTNFVGPKEKLKDINVEWKAKGQFPVGQITVPIKWTMKAQ